MLSKTTIAPEKRNAFVAVTIAVVVVVDSSHF